MPTIEHDFSLEAELAALLGPLHVEWPMHADGGHKTIGEMTPDERRAQTAAAARRLAAEYVPEAPEDRRR